ncbi:MAG: hypothetical protein P0S95_02465 [Rhabdochlamydiaceae bacterium]|nr:hypothetical protein [Candidatus Amphrikana amoebophyrae]
MSFHDGCNAEFEYVCKELDFNLTQAPQEVLSTLDGQHIGNNRYNITHARAEKAWLTYQDYFNSFDGVIVSDTSALARIFLQNDWQKPLIVWVTNRFDYADRGNQGTRFKFPDSEFYDLIRSISNRPNVAIAYSTIFEKTYAREIRGVDVEGPIIKATGWGRSGPLSNIIIPSLKHQQMVFFPPYQNEFAFTSLPSALKRKSIPFYHKKGHWGGPFAIKEFKAIVHLPYAPTTIALFENIRVGLVHVIPSFRLMKSLLKSKKYFFQATHTLEMVRNSEWYLPENKAFFDSFRDLRRKLTSIDFEKKKKQVYQLSVQHKDNQLALWKKLLNPLFLN